MQNSSSSSLLLAVHPVPGGAGLDFAEALARTRKQMRSVEEATQLLPNQFVTIGKR